MQATAATPRLKILLMFALLFVVICDQMPLRHPQESLWLRQSLKIRTTLETLSCKSTKSTKRTLNLYFQTRDQPRAAIRSPVAEECCRACMHQLPMDRVRRALSMAVQQGRRTGGRRGKGSPDDERCRPDGGGGACRVGTGLHP